MRLFTIFLRLVHKFLELEYDDSLRQYLTSGRGNTHEKKFWGSKFGPNRPKSDLKLGFSQLNQAGSFLLF